MQNFKNRVYNAVNKCFEGSSGVCRQQIVSIVKINSSVTRAVIDVITKDMKSYLLDMILRESGSISIYRYDKKDSYVLDEREG